VTEPDRAVFRSIARERGLPLNAVKFLSGGTVTEVEQSADQLAALLQERDEQHERAERLHSPTGLFERARAEKAERRERLMGALFGRTRQPRDERGKFAATDRPVAAGFDGGVRAVPRRQQSHSEWLGAALRSGIADVGGDF
jgi:hypothetical protein